MAAVTGDIDVAVSGGATYNYMLIERDGVKAWRYRPIFTQPPDMTKGIITCTILAADKMRQDDGTVLTDTRGISYILAELVLCNAEEATALIIQGHDGGTYHVFMSQTPITYRAIYDISGRQELYEVDLEFIVQHT